jgi:hypothetical protein
MRLVMIMKSCHMFQIIAQVRAAFSSRHVLPITVCYCQELSKFGYITLCFCTSGVCGSEVQSVYTTLRKNS